MHAQFPRVLHVGDKGSTTEVFPQPSGEHFPITVKKNSWGKQLKGGKIYSGSVIGRGTLHYGGGKHGSGDDMGRAGDISHKAHPQ